MRTEGARLAILGGFAYTAEAPGAPGGVSWNGENPMAAEDDLATSKFSMVAIRETFVACDYEGDGPEAGMRMSLRVSGAKPSGENWQGNECEAKELSCLFEAN